MKKRAIIISGLTGLLVLSSCNDEKVISTNQLVRTISVTGQDFIDGDGIVGTRSSYSVDGTGFHFTWTQGDTVGIYPVGGDQVAFPISSGEGSQTAQFDGGAWALRSSYSYAAYYPFSSGNYHIDETSLPVNYVGQSQNGNGTLDGMDRFDYQASVATNPDADGNVNISLKHLGCFVRIQLTMPMADTYKSVTLQSNNTPFVTSGTYDLTQETVAITPITTSSSITIKLNNTSTTADNKVLTIYAMMAPADLSSSEITITVAGTTYQLYAATVNGKNMQASKAYSYAATVKSGTNINGSDVEWDDNGEEVIHVEYEYVDLGLSVNWATFNVGATAPEEYGDYFAWGETEPHYEAGYAQEKPQTHWNDGYSEGYTWSTYMYSIDSNRTLTKYCGDSSYGYNGYIDSLITLVPDDDVAHIKWGDSWRMPTKEEREELSDTANCTWTWTTEHGVNGYRVTSRIPGFEGHSIFLPAAGIFMQKNLQSVGDGGYYWTSSVRTKAYRYDWWDFGWYLDFDKGGIRMASDSRFQGLTVRPVCPSETWINDLSITLDKTQLSMFVDSRNILTATVNVGSSVINYFPVTWSSGDTSVVEVYENGSIKALAVGTTIITATCKEKTAICTVVVNARP